MQKLEEVNVKVLVLYKQSHKSSQLSSLWNIEWCIYFYRGASIIKWTKKVLRYMKTMIFLVKRL